MSGIYRYRDALDLPRIDANQLDSCPAAGVFVERPGRKRTFRRGAPLFHDDPDNVRLFSDFPEDQICGPPAFVASARRAAVVGFRTVITENQLFFNDDSNRGALRAPFLKEFGMPDPLNEETGLTPHGVRGAFTLDFRDRSIEKVEGSAVLLSSAEPSNYGSWLFRVLPKLRTIQQIRFHKPVRYLVWAGYPAFLEYLRILGIPTDQVIQHDPQRVIYQVDRIIVPSIRNNQAFLDPQSVAFFAGVRDRLGRPKRRGSRIYVSRLHQSQNGSSRVMMNEPELVKRLAALGFRIVTPERLSAVQQIRAFSSAELVVGPSGSAMFNVVFCHPGTKIIDIESEPHWIHAHRSLFASCGLQFGIFVGKSRGRSFRKHHQPWTVNIDALLSRIRLFLRA